ncbi:MAG: DNA repair protein RecN [Gammaproteobacteria bacterium]|nr:DNA repair protein RecN [Gammaproteobacteria bacterium]
MLTHIFIRNFAIIDELDLDLKNGMTTLTGETGAGKSILLDALGLILGDRADSNNVKHGCDKADISASFDITALPELQHWLTENDLDDDLSECIIRRVVSKDGRSKAYINGSTASLQQIRQAGEMLIDIHGQHEHQSLMRRDIQRRLLDDFASHNELLGQVREAYQVWFETENKLTELQSKSKDRNERVALLKYQVEELELLEPQENEYDALVTEHNQLANIDKHTATCADISDTLYDSENSLYSVISQKLKAVAALNSAHPDLLAATELLTDAQTQISEAARLAKNYLDNLDNDPQKLNEIELRLNKIHEQARKHHIEPDQLYATFSQLSEELEQLSNADESLLTLNAERDRLKQNYLKLAKELSTNRLKAAKKLGAEISNAMQTLNMSGGVFNIHISQHEPLKCSAEGYDSIDFLVSANPGQPEKLLAKVASGGELARISLAIQMITANQTHIPTLIFDEVDSGVGGATAEIVGQHLRTIGKQCQVLCVTHLPQVAAQAHHHLLVNKTSTATSTHTTIKILDDTDKQQEIARMLGGVDITRQTLDHAQQMIENAAANG